MSSNKIIEFINEKHNKSFCLNDIKNTFKLEETELLKIINKLEVEGIIYKLDKNKYCKMPENYYIGELQSTKKGNHYVELENSKRIYINNKDLNEALNFDKVIVEKIGENNENLNGRIVKIINRKNSKIVCEVINTSTIKNLEIFNYNYKQKLTLSKDEIKNLVVGDRIIVSMPIDGNPTLIEKIGHKDDPDNDIKSIAASRDISIEFSEFALKEANNMPKEVSNEDIKNRLDLREKTIFTIDSSHTKDMDDAISIELLPNGNYELGVHIANVSNYIKYGSELFKEAEERGNSVYLLEYVIAMLPHIISNGICSLNPNVDRLTKSCIMEIDIKGNIINYRIVDSVINSKRKMTYEDVNEILENNNIPNGYEKYVDDLKLMNKLSNILTNKRKNKGALEFCSNEIRTDLDNSGKATNFELENHGTSEKIIENFMVAANETIASHIFWLGFPGVFRIHEAPNEKSVQDAIELINNIGFKIKSHGDFKNPKTAQNVLNQLSDKEQFWILSNIFLRGMKRARYDTENLGHFGLALEYYTHFTSPIRRFSDLLVHMLLDKYNNLENIKDMKGFINKLDVYLKDCCEHISYKERQADLAEEDANKFKMLEYMEQHIGEKFEATIMMIDSKSLNIRTDSLITGKINLDSCFKYIYDDIKKKIINKNTKEQYKIGHKILVEAKEVSKFDKEIYFNLIKNISNEIKKEKVLIKK